jgi:hypothetical protein
VKYAVHVGDGLLDRTTLRSEHRTRGEAREEAKRLIREEGARSAEVRYQRRLFDSFVRRGRTPYQIYAFQQRGGER